MSKIENKEVGAAKKIKKVIRGAVIAGVIGSGIALAIQGLTSVLVPTLMGIFGQKVPGIGTKMPLWISKLMKLANAPFKKFALPIAGLSALMSILNDEKSLARKFKSPSAS